MPAFRIIPNDLLFFRDARPMTASEGSGGHGARWPVPSVIFDALHAALWRAWPDVQSDWEHPHRWGRSGDRDYSRPTSQRFGSLATAGPFPAIGKSWLMSVPADVTRAHEREPAVTLRLQQDSLGGSNLPYDWLRSLLNPAAATKEKPAPWWNKAAIEAYLNGLDLPADSLHAKEAVFDSEWTTGIGTDPLTGTQNGTDIYSAEYLRLTEGAGLGIHATMPLKERRGEEGITRLFDGGGRTIIVGGQQRGCAVCSEDRSLGDLLPVGGTITGNKVKWMLLSPAVFPAIPANPGKDVLAHPGGWLPGWIREKDGQVMLRPPKEPRQPGTSRAEWRAASSKREPIPAKLVAACVPKPVVITGWSDYLQAGHDSGRTIGVRATMLAVPAGAAYYFECKDETAALQLADALNWHGGGDKSAILNRRSTLMGEKGFGLGVCGPW